MSEVEDGDAEVAASEYEIAFDHVDFSYPNSEELVLRDVTFRINPGEKVCIVGRNGAGKSTIVKLLCGLYQPDRGSILINGVNIDKIPVESMKRIRSVVFQDYFKYFSTIRENVSYSDLENMFDDLKIENALMRAQANDYIAALPDQLETHLGNIEDDGVDLSNGQWQKIAIARACFAKSRFVILDEPTASLDPVAESLMYHTFSEALKDTGYVCISHRLVSAKLADRIIVIDNGQIIEDGNHEELMKQQGLYAKMFREQSAWYITAGEA